ncbi:hypothetical protein R1flu_023022 [Riccia fluitans]|uniref:Uncharacterized protein n=1 Tax=Riccia fluitans TaxID=41844 RepID=A0ABD1XQU8_9MARC
MDPQQLMFQTATGGARGLALLAFQQQADARPACSSSPFDKVIAICEQPAREVVRSLARTIDKGRAVCSIHSIDRSKKGKDMATKPWGGAGAWAAEAEQADAEAKAKGTATLPSEQFPSLEVSIATKPKKKKAQTLTLSELATGVYVGPGGRTRQQSMSDSQRLTTEELMFLPTAPRERSEEDTGGRGFRDYGTRGSDRLGFGDRGSDREPRDRSFGVGFERGDRDERRSMGSTREPRDDGPSRADEADNWGATKKAPTTPSYVGGRGGGGYDDHDRNERRMSDRDLPSRADEVDNWGATKKFVPMPAADGYGERRTGRGVGFEDRRGGGGGFDDGHGVPSRADESSNWGATKKTVPTPAPPERRGGGGFETYNRGDAGPDSDRWSRRAEIPPREEVVARPAERRRLVLQPRTIPVENPLPTPLRIDRNGENERPLSSHSTRSDRSVALSETNSLTSDTSATRKPRSNPFGAARPREEVLAEKGQDWRKIDAELELKSEKFSRPSSSHSSRSSRPQTPEVGAGEGLHKTRPRVSPFGDAKPRERESHYEDRGNKDWRKFDVDLHDRPAREQVQPPPEEDNVQTVS